MLSLIGLNKSRSGVWSRPHLVRLLYLTTPRASESSKQMAFVGRRLSTDSAHWGAPILLELDDTEIREWAVSPSPDRHVMLDRFLLSKVDSTVASRAQVWKPAELLRAKSLGTLTGGHQLSPILRIDTRTRESNPRANRSLFSAVRCRTLELRILNLQVVSPTTSNCLSLSFGC